MERIGTATTTRTAHGRLDVSGQVRRTRRLADLSQRDLASHIGVAPATIARIEAGGAVGVAMLQQILSTARLRLAVLDENGVEVVAMSPDVLRDRGGRRLPAHLDAHAAPEPQPLHRLMRETVPADIWHDRRRRRDRIRLATGASAHDDQPTRRDTSPPGERPTGARPSGTWRGARCRDG